MSEKGESEKVCKLTRRGGNAAPARGEIGGRQIDSLRSRLTYLSCTTVSIDRLDT